MVLANTDICAFGTKAHGFALKGVDGKTYTLADVRGKKGTLVAFICNHCPYVRAVISRLVAEADALAGLGIGTIAIMLNDTATYREDSFDNMKSFAARHGFSFSFPYVIDETQQVAKAYGAQCTPTSSVSMPPTSCNIGAGSMPRARASFPMRGATCSRR